MNARTHASILALAVLSLGGALLPAQSALAEKPARIEARQEGEDVRKAPRQDPGRAQSRTVKQQAVPAQGGTTATAARQDPGPRGAPGVPGQGRESRGGPRPPSTYVPDRGQAGDSHPRHDSPRPRDDSPHQRYDSSHQRYDSSHQRYDSTRYRHAGAQHHHRSPRTVHHHYPARRYYYPPRGYVAPVLPRHVVVVRHRHDHYWYGGGVWYRPYGARYVVVAPPLGVFVSVLPAYYGTFWYGGIPYYYANDAYYVWRETRRAYEVVAAPAGADTVAADPVAEDIFVYPREGQDEEQVAFDRYECHRWASDQTGFDPTQPWGGVAEDQAGALRDAYLRAMTACLEGRGYTVR